MESLQQWKNFKTAVILVDIVVNMLSDTNV